MRQSDTSKAAYKDVKDAGEDKSFRRQLLIELMALGDATRRELARAVGKETSINSVSARMRELLDMGLVETTGDTRLDPETDAHGQVLQPSPTAQPWLDGEYEPDEETSDDVREEVVNRARELVNADGQLRPSTAEKANALGGLVSAVEDLEARDGRL